MPDEPTAPNFDPPPVTSVEEVAALFPEHEILRVLGEGGMGVVYLARHRRHRRLEALKLLSAKYGCDAEAVARFEREARAMARLSHPNIVTAYDSGRAGGERLYLTMEYVDGTDLAALIRAGAVDQFDPLSIGGQICDALAYAHGEGVIHRDIKPANVLVDAKGRVKVADFGLARMDADLDASVLTTPGAVMGTLGYISPEQRRGDAVDHRADIFSLGAVFYEMLCHERPAGTFVPPSTRSGCDPRWDAIIQRAMQADPARRYTSTTEIRAALDEIRTTAYSPPAPAAARPAPKPQRWMLAAVGALAAIVIGSLLYWQKLQPARPSLPLVGNVTEPQSYPNPKRWVNDLPRVSEIARAFETGEMRDGRLQINSSCGLTLADGLQLDDVAVRVVGRGRIRIGLRGVTRREMNYAGFLEETGLAGIVVMAGSRTMVPSETNQVAPKLPAEPILLDPAFDPNQDHEVVFVAKGDVLSLWVDRVLITSVRDRTLPGGAFHLACWAIKPNTPAAQNFKSVEYASLDETLDDNSPVPAPTPPPGSAAHILTSADYEWSAPVNLGPLVNTPKYDTGPSMTADGLRMIVNSDPTDFSKLIEFRRKSLTEPFGEPRPVPNAPAVTLSARSGISPDGLSLIYTVYHPKVLALVHRQRPGLEAPWGPPVEIEHPETPIGFRTSPWISADGLTLLYTGKHEGCVHTQDIWRARRRSVADRFDLPENLGPGVNSLLQDDDPCLSTDGTALLFIRKMLHNWPTSEMHIGIADAKGRFHVRELDWPLKGLFTTPWLSSDGHTLWFSWDGPGGEGGMDLWQIRRVPKKGKDPTIPYPLEASKKLAATAKALAAPPPLQSVSRFSTPAAKATKDAPFVNKLGMKFVPVEVTIGPNAGRFVLYSIWETRVRDYEVFVKETKREWPKPDFPQGPDHPAVNVSWDDGVAFAEWLTARDRKAGAISSDESYRLPEDIEWSCAAGIGHLEYLGKSASKRVMEHLDVFPWGAAWPPPAAVGNYAGEECRTTTGGLASSAFTDVIEGYRDGFVHTAPVGSFAANAIGLHDMGGNVLEWTVTSFDISFTKRVVRGGSWQLGTRFGAHAFARVGIPLAERNPNQGLRLVLVTQYGSQKEAPGASPAKAPDAPTAIPPPPVMEAKPVIVKETAQRPMPVPATWVDETAALRKRALAAGIGRLEGDHLLMVKAMPMDLADQKVFRDVIVRMRFIGVAGIGVRKAPVQGSQAKASYQAQLDPTPLLRLFGWHNSLNKHLCFPTLEWYLAPGFDWKAEHELALAVQGDQLTVWLDGRTMLVQRDSTIPAGSLYLNLWTPEKFPHLAPRIRKVEYGELGGTPAPAAARPVK